MAQRRWMALGPALFVCALAWSGCLGGPHEPEYGLEQAAFEDLLAIAEAPLIDPVDVAPWMASLPTEGLACTDQNGSSFALHAWYSAVRSACYRAAAKEAGADYATKDLRAGTATTPTHCVPEPDTGSCPNTGSQQSPGPQPDPSASYPDLPVLEDASRTTGILLEEARAAWNDVNAEGAARWPQLYARLYLDLAMLDTSLELQSDWSTLEEPPHSRWTHRLQAVAGIGGAAQAMGAVATILPEVPRAGCWLLVETPDLARLQARFDAVRSSPVADGDPRRADNLHSWMRFDLEDIERLIDGADHGHLQGLATSLDTRITWQEERARAAMAPVWPSNEQAKVLLVALNGSARPMPLQEEAHHLQERGDFESREAWSDVAALVDPVALTKTQPIASVRHCAE